jgi:hypothetical protein
LRGSLSFEAFCPCRLRLGAQAGLAASQQTAFSTQPNRFTAKDAKGAKDKEFTAEIAEGTEERKPVDFSG